jgi:hypothetical protein
MTRRVCLLRPFFFHTFLGRPSRPSSGSSSSSSDSTPRSGPNGMSAWLSSTCTSGILTSLTTLAFLGIGIPCSSISISRMMSASSSSLSSSSFLMACIIELRLRPRPRRFHGMGRTAVSSSSSIALSALFLRRKAGVASPRSVELGVPCSSCFLFFGVMNWSKSLLFPADCGVLSPRALDSCDASFVCSLRLGVCTTLSSTSVSTALLLLGVPSGSESNRPSTMPSRCGVGPMTLGP